MGYIFLAVSLFAGAVKGYCGKKTSTYTDRYESAVFVNLIRMLLCIIIGIIIIFFGGNSKHLAVDFDTLLISAISGISTSVFVVCWLMSVKKSAYMLLDVFLTLGIIIPLVLSSLFFGENVKFTQRLGLAIVVIGVLFMCSYNSSIKEKISISSMLVLIICGISNGITDFSQKLFVHLASDKPISVFNFYTYAFSAATLLIIYLTCKKSTHESVNNQVYSHKVFVYVLVMSICLFANSYFKTMAAGFLDAVKLYPLSQGGALILSSVMSMLLFGEKITVKSFIGTLLAFIGLIVINIL